MTETDPSLSAAARERLSPQNDGSLFCIIGSEFSRDTVDDLASEFSAFMKRGGIAARFQTIAEPQLDDFGELLTVDVRDRLADNFAIVTIGVRTAGLEKIGQTFAKTGLDSPLIVVGNADPPTVFLPIMKRYSADGFWQAVTEKGSGGSFQLRQEINTLLTPRPTVIDNGDVIGRFLKRTKLYPDHYPVVGWINTADAFDRRASIFLEHGNIPFPVFSVSNSDLFESLILQLREQQSPVKLVNADGTPELTASLLKKYGMANAEIRKSLFILAADTTEMSISDPSVTDQSHYIPEFGGQGGTDAYSLLAEALKKD